MRTSAPGRRTAIPARSLLMGALTALIVIGAIIGLGINFTAPAADHQLRIAQFFYLCDPIWFSLIGGYLVIRLPRNLTGWALWVVGSVQLSSSWVQGLLNHASALHDIPAGVVGWSAWLDNWTWVLAFAGLFVLVLYFPEGRQPGRGWQLLELGWYAIVTLTVLLAMAMTTSVDHPGIAVPVDLGPLSRFAAKAAGTVVVVLVCYFAAGLLALVANLVIRWRRAHGAQRAQLQWLLAACAAVVIVIVVSSVLSAAADGGLVPQVVNELGDLASQLTIPAIAVAVAVAVTRHGLFEIDRVVSRTVSYTLLVVVLAGAYAAVVSGISVLVPDTMGALPVVAATLAASALFVPVRRRVIKVVDHRFNRSRYEAAVVVAGFAEKVRGRAGLGTTGDELIAAAAQVLQPAHASVWLVPRSQP